MGKINEEKSVLGLCVGKMGGWSQVLQNHAVHVTVLIATL